MCWRGPSEVAGNRVVTQREVAEHNTAEDCWVIVHGKVYDVTSYVPNHPGGAMIYVKAGGDCTQLFDSYHSKPYVRCAPLATSGLTWAPLVFAHGNTRAARALPTSVRVDTCTAHAAMSAACMTDVCRSPAQEVQTPV